MKQQDDLQSVGEAPGAEAAMQTGGIRAAGKTLEGSSVDVVLDVEVAVISCRWALYRAETLDFFKFGQRQKKWKPSHSRMIIKYLNSW